MIVAGPRAHLDMAQLTGPDGAFRFDDLAPGSYRLMARSATGAGGRGTADADPDAEVTLVLRVGGTEAG